MKPTYLAAMLSISLAAPRAVSAQVDVRTTINLVSLEVAASAFGKRVLFELGLSLDVLRDRRDDARDPWYSGAAQRAEDARQARDWSRAAELWQQALLGNDTSPDHWNSYADALYNDGRHRESIAAYQRAIQLGADRPGDAALNVARAYAHLGNRKQALRWVERSLELGGASKEGVRDDEDFAKYRDDPAFRELVAPLDVSKVKVAEVRALVRAVAIGW